MLETIPAPQTYSNYFCDIDANGYWKENPFYFEVLYRNVRGTFPVPVVHCTYLIKADQIPKLTYLDGTIDFEFVIFSRSARNHGVQQYICNEEHFGYLFLPSNTSELGKIDLETEQAIFENLEVPLFR